MTTTRPVAIESRARCGAGCPSICVNGPPTYTVDAVGPGNNASTDPFTCGANPALITPVVASNANRCGRDNTGDHQSDSRSSNVPPTTIVFPTCVIECVCPLLIPA